MQINDIAPDFEADTSEGRIHFHDWIGNSWAVLFSHPKDFTPVCTTELGYMAKLKPEFDRRNTKIIGLSVDPVSDHTRWAQDIKETQGYAPNYPMIGDPDLKISKAYEMLPASAGSSSQGRTPADNQTVRNVFVIGPDKRIKLSIAYPMTTGRNFDEVLRVLDSLQLTAKHKVATPVNWSQGDDVIIAGSVSDEEAKKIFPQGWKAPRPYLRIVPQRWANQLARALECLGRFKPYHCLADPRRGGKRRRSRAFDDICFLPSPTCVCWMRRRKVPIGARSRGSYCTSTRSANLIERDGPSRAIFPAPNKARRLLTDAVEKVFLHR
jgi:alkyl hydroperoxide reductase subunit AhpC